MSAPASVQPGETARPRTGSIQTASIQAVVVLYRACLAESATCRTLRSLLDTNAALRTRFRLLIADNSPEPQAVPDDVDYLHDLTNPGLSSRYNAALAMAVRQGATWLLLLDQDTTLTAAWWAELEELSRALAEEASIVAIAPRLVTRLPRGDRTESPHLPRFLPADWTLGPDTHGVLPGLVRVYNSAALVRVSALQAIDGFPPEYPLDSLDHATFHRLQAAGGRVYLMRSSLAHDMSIYRPDRNRDPAYAARHHGRLTAELRFFRQHGTPAERRAYRLNLLRQCAGTLLRGHFAEATRFLRASVTGT